MKKQGQRKKSKAKEREKVTGETWIKTKSKK
jgi:hypothetical protein